MKHARSYFLIALACLLFGASAVFGASGISPTNVNITEITPKKLRVYKSYIGYLKPQDRVIVRSQTSGTVEEINFEEGKNVTQGDELVHISTNELELKKTIAKTNYDQALSDYQVEKNLYLAPASGNAGEKDKPMHVSLRQKRLQADLAKADYEHAQAEYEVQKRLYEKNMTSSTSFDSYRTTLEIKRITWQQAELEFEQAAIKDLTRLESFQNTVRINQVNVKLATLELEKSKVRAPFSGVVTRKIVQMGGFIQNGSDLVEIMDISKVLVRINIPEKEMQYTAVGKPVSIRLDAVPGEEFQGTIKTLGLEADTKSRSFPADVLIDNTSQKLLPGMMARVEILAKSESNQIIIPRHAVLERLRGSMVFVVKKGKAVQVPVVTGEMIEENVQIMQGLQMGDKLVVVGQELLANNEAVTITNRNQKLVRNVSETDSIKPQ